jgi:hypothetical protein
MNKQILKEAHLAAEELRCSLNDHPHFTTLANKVLMLIHLASHHAHGHTCQCEHIKYQQNINNINMLHRKSGSFPEGQEHTGRRTPKFSQR